MTETSNRVPLALLAATHGPRHAPASEAPTLYAGHPPVDPYRPTNLTDVCTDGYACFHDTAYEDAEIINLV